MDLWYTEKHGDNVGITMKITQTLFSGKSKFQQLDIVETREFSRMMLLDGLVMVTECDEFIYHDMIVHPALFTHPRPKKALVAGGSDGGSIREIMKHPEIDGNNPRVKLHVDDGLAYIRDHQKEFDIILVDSTDPIGPPRFSYPLLQ